MAEPYVHRLAWYVHTQQGAERVGYVVAAHSERAARLAVRRRHRDAIIREILPLRFPYAWEVSRWAARDPLHGSLPADTQRRTTH